MKIPLSRRRFPVYLIFLLLAWKGAVYAQDENKFRLYTANDGLSNNNITGIVQDNHGFLWIGSMRGLNRFDGKHFVQFHADNDSHSLPDETVTRLCWIDSNRLALHTTMGLHIINTLTGETNDIIIPAPDQKQLYKFNTVMSALSDEQGNIYVLTRSGFYHYNALYKLAYRYDYYPKEATDTAWFEFGNNLYRLSANEILMNTINGLYIYNPPTRRLQKITIAHPLLQKVAGIQHNNYFIRQIEPGRLIAGIMSTDSIYYIDGVNKIKILSTTSFPLKDNYFGWRSKLFRVNDSLCYLTGQQNGFLKMFINRHTGKITIQAKEYFPDYRCNDFVVDREKRLWIATNAGLLKETTNATSVWPVSIPASLVKQNPAVNIRQLLCYKNKLYVACSGNGGLLVYDKNTLSFLYSFSFKKFHPNADNIFSLLPYRGDTILVGTYGPLLWLKTSTGQNGVVSLDGWDQIHNWISYQYKDSHDNIWVTTNDNSKIYLLTAGAGRFRRLKYDVGVFNRLVGPIAILEDKQGNIWFGGHGLCRINPASGKPDLFLDSFPYIRFPRKETTAFEFDKNNILWAGILNNGLVAYDITRKTFRHFTTREGLPDNYIKVIYPVGNKLWIATATGMASLDLRSNTIARFGTDDGFLSLPVSNTSLWYDTATRYLFSGFTTHIIRFNPDSLLITESPPSIFFENIAVYNDTTFYHPGKTITLPYYKNDITVTVGSINYNEINNQRLSYHIVNSKDMSWWPLSGDHINFNNLSPGSYRLQVKLSSINNRWPSQEKEIQIIITPPFWDTLWFAAFAVIGVLTIIYLLYIQKIKMIRRTERAKVQVQELKAEEYKTRLELEKISYYFSSSLAGKKDINDILWDVATNLIGHLGYEDCMIYLWNDAETKMLQKAGYGPKGTPEAIARKEFDVLPGQGVVGYVMQTKEPVLINDTRKDKRYRVDEVFRLSEICVPVIHNNELMGVIDCEHRCAHNFKERDLKILTTIATLVGNKIKQIESEKSLEVNREALATINEQLAEAQLTALQTQMNPHFIFNALNSIKRMILDNENRNASRYLSKFAQMIRLTLNHSKETFVTLQETIEYLYAYLDMEQLRFGSSFSYTIETKSLSNEEDIHIPTLMIQPLAENAIWHGLMHQDGNKKIIIRFERCNEMVTCTIEDNGIGIRQSEKMKRVNKPPSVGLDNLRNRIKIINEKYGMCCSLEITDLSEQNNQQTGTLAILQFKTLIH